MRYLIQANTIDVDSGICYAIANLCDEAKEYLLKRRNAFIELSKTVEDLFDIRCSGFDFLSFFDDTIKINKLLDDEQLNSFEELGYCLVPDDFGDDFEMSEVEFVNVEINELVWVVSGQTSGEMEVKTSAMLFEIIK